MFSSTDQSDEWGGMNEPDRFRVKELYVHNKNKPVEWLNLEYCTVHAMDVLQKFKS